MKLIFCKDCHDIYPLTYELKHCRCGSTCGRYTGNPTAEIFGESAVPIGLANEDINRVDEVQRNGGLTNLIRCWVIRPGDYDYKECKIDKHWPEKILKEL